jgi:hypothetical protein
MHKYSRFHFLLVIVFSVFSYFGVTTSEVHAQEFTLEPSEASITIPVHLPNEGYGVNVLLKQNGNLLLNQSDIQYDWQVSGENSIQVHPNKFDNGCPYDIQSPCPSLNATILGRNPGRTTITVFATKNQKLLAKTTIQVVVKTEIYTLEPSEEEIDMVFTSQNGSGYGVNVLLKKNNQLVMDQQGVSYRWKTGFDGSIRLTNYGFQSGCPYYLVAPCPNMHADISAIGVGRTIVTVDALIGDSVIASTTFAVNVRDSAMLPSITPKPSTMPSPSPVVYSTPSPVPDKSNYEGEQILRLQQQVETLEKRVDEQQSLLERIVAFFRRFF